MFPNEAVANNAYQALSKMFARMKGTLEPKGAAEPTSSDEQLLPDYVLQLQKKLVRQQRKVILRRKLNKRVLRVQRSEECLTSSSNVYIPSNSLVTCRKKHALENGTELLWVKHRDSMCNERRACNAISSQNVDLEVADPNPLRTPCDKSARQSPGCEKDMDATRINPKYRQATVCQTCGVTGYSELLVFCIDCQISAVHRYCLHEMPENNEVEVSWSCEECRQRFPKNIKEQWRRSEEDNGVEEVKPFRISRICTDQNSLKVNAIETKDGHDHAIVRPFTGCRNSFSERLLDVSAGQLEDQVATQVPYDHDAPLNSSCCQPLAEYDGYVHAQPIIEPIWRGCFDVDNSEYGMIVGHLSNKACSKVHEGAMMLPPVLCAKKLPRTDSWPKAFERSHPTDDSIGLYFFPESWRDERVFDQLLHDMNGQDIALKFAADEADLLIFSSLLLPQQSWRFCEKYYLWGVFKGRKGPP